MKVSDEEFSNLVSQATAWVDVVRALHLSDKAAGNWGTVQRRAARLGLNVDHIVSSGRNRTPPTSQAQPLNEIMVPNSTYRTFNLATRLIKEGVLPRECSSCKNTEWLGLPIALELDHINGINTDHRLENLRFLCPNCHAQTDTWRGRKNKKEKARCSCGSEMWRTSKSCRPCSHKLNRKTKIEWPPKEVVIEWVANSNYEEVGRRLGISGNSVRKFLRRT